MSFVVGIDLGTTNFAICVIENGRPKMLEDGQQNTTFPSAVFRKKGGWIVGYAARTARLKEPSLGAYAVKRLMGLRYDSPERPKLEKGLGLNIRPLPNGNCGVLLGEELFSPTEIAAQILKNAYEMVRQKYSQEPEEVVITVPAYFNHGQRQATKEAAQMADLPCQRIINEPTAAAIAYGMRVSQRAKVLVFDMGGGTFDVSILHFAGGIVETLAICGDTFLGGEDFDEAIVNHLVTIFEGKYAQDLREHPMALRRLKEAAETAKCELSYQKTGFIALPQLLPGCDLEVTLSREELQRMTKPLVDKAMKVVQQSLDDAELRPTDIDKVILVGGQTRMPVIRDSITNFFHQEPSKGVHPDEVVAKGAALHAASLLGEIDAPMLFDVTPFDLGIDVQAGLFQTLIPKNTRIPSSASEKFVLYYGKTQVKIVVRQGHSRFSQENEFLGEFRVQDLSLRQNGQAELEISFRLDGNGMLNVTAKDMVSKNTIQMKMRNYGEFIRADEEFSNQVTKEKEDFSDNSNTTAKIGVGDSSISKGLSSVSLKLDEDDIVAMDEIPNESELQIVQNLVATLELDEDVDLKTEIQKLSNSIDDIANQNVLEEDFALELDLEEDWETVKDTTPKNPVSERFSDSANPVLQLDEEPIFDLSQSLLDEEEEFVLQLEDAVELVSIDNQSTEDTSTEVLIGKTKESLDVLDDILHAGLKMDFAIPQDDFFWGLTEAITGKPIQKLGQDMLSQKTESNTVLADLIAEDAPLIQPLKGISSEMQAILFELFPA